MWALRASARAAAAGGAAQGFIRRAAPSAESFRLINIATFGPVQYRSPLPPKVNPLKSSVLHALEICPTPHTVKSEVKKIIEMANQASSSREILHTNFLTPPVLKKSMLALKEIADIKVVAQGGYSEAERCRLSIGHQDILTSDPDIVAAMSISGNFGSETYGHGDFLRAILGTVISRDHIGDIFLQGQKGVQFLVVPELVDFLVSSLKKVRNIPVTCEKIPLHSLKYQQPRIMSFETMETSQQLDTIASAYPPTVGMISEMGVRVNGVRAAKCHMTVQMGDILSVNYNTRLQSAVMRKRTAPAMMNKQIRKRAIRKRASKRSSY